jgi:rhodanese-related sulfurtransferase
MGFFDKLFGGKKEAAPAAAPAPAKPAAKQEWAASGAVPQELAAIEVEAMLRRGEKAVLVDVREEWERQRDGWIDGAIHIPMGEFEARHAEVPRGVPVIVYCASGMRSMEAGAYLLENGYDDVSNMNGGIAAWKGDRRRANA